MLFSFLFIFRSRWSETHRTAVNPIIKKKKNTVKVSTTFLQYGIIFYSHSNEPFAYFLLRLRSIYAYFHATKISLFESPILFSNFYLISGNIWTLFNYGFLVETFSLYVPQIGSLTPVRRKTKMQYICRRNGFLVKGD